MSGQTISQSLKKFVKEQIQSVFILEVLLLLHRTPHRSFTASEIADELGLESDLAQQQLSKLVSAHLLSATDGDLSNYRYDPVGEERASMVDQLAIAYEKQRVPILSLILTEHRDRIRGFAEAFRLIE